MSIYKTAHHHHLLRVECNTMRLMVDSVEHMIAQRTAAAAAYTQTSNHHTFVATTHSHSHI